MVKGDIYDDTPVMSRRVLNYVKWKHRAQRSRQLLVAGAILFCASILAIIFFLLLVFGVIPTTRLGEQITIEKTLAGSHNGQDIYRYTLRNEGGAEVEVITLGCTLTAVRVPDRTGTIADVLLGYGDILDYSRSHDPILSSVIGRCTGFTRGQYTLDGRVYTIGSQNPTKYSNWNTMIWDAVAGTDDVTFNHVSPDGELGFPGEVHVNVTFRLTTDNEIVITYSATVSQKASPINLMVTPYMNLAGEGGGRTDRHRVTVYSDRYLQLRDDGSPSGDIMDVNGTAYDLRAPGDLSSLLVPSGHPVGTGTCSGHPVTYSVRGASGKRLVASVYEPSSGRTLNMYTDQPAVQLDPGCSLHITGGKTGHVYSSSSGFSLSSLNYPQAILHADLTDSVLRPGSIYQHTVWYKFGSRL